MGQMNDKLFLVLLVAVLGFEASSGARYKVSADTSILEVLQAEALDTITLDRAVHFTTTEATDVVTQAGLYRIRVAEPSGMEFIGLKTHMTAVVDALHIHHQTDINEPVALYIKDDQQFPHVVLLLPGGRGVEAVGSYDEIRSRDLHQLTASQIQNALEQKKKEQ